MIKIIKEKPLPTILLLAFSLRIIYFIAIVIYNPEGFYVHDSNGYWNIALNLKTHGVFSQSIAVPIIPDYFRTPVYPLFIVLAESIHIETYPIIILQIVLGMLTCYYTFKLSQLITNNKFISCVAALLLAIDVPNIVMNNLVLTETLFTFLLVANIYFFVKYLQEKSTKLLLFVSIMSGLLMLCRPISFFIPIFFAVFILYAFRTEKLKAFSRIFILFVITLATISPWLIRNKNTFNHYFLSVIREHDMQNYQAAAIYAELNNISLAEAQGTLRRKTYTAFGNEAYKYPYEYARMIEDDAFHIMFSNPKLLLKHHAVQFMHFFFKPCRAYIDLQLGNWGIGYDQIPKDVPIFAYLFKHNSKLTITAVFFQLFILLITYLSCIFGFIYFKQQKQLFYFFLLGGLIFCFANLTLPDVTESRFRAPVVPYIAIIAACGIYFLRTKFKNKRLQKQHKAVISLDF